MNQVKVSVILSTYNRAHMLPRMMNCILKQDFKDFELILINNGSIDDTDELCKEYKDMDQRIRYFCFEENKGIFGAKNFGLDKAEGNFICFVDDDDFCEENYLSLLFNIIKEHDADIAVSGCVDEYGDKIIPKFDYKEIYVWNREEAVSEFLKREKFNAAPPTKMFKKELFDHIAFLPCVGPDDIHVVYKLFVQAKKVVVCGRPTYRFHKHDGNVTAFITKDILDEKILDEYLKMQKERVEYITTRIPSLTNQVRYSAYSYMISMVEKIATGHAIGCSNQLDYIMQELRKNKNEFITSKWITEREKNLMDKYLLGSDI